MGRRLTRNRITRRKFLQRAGVVAGAAALAGCAAPTIQVVRETVEVEKLVTKEPTVEEAIGGHTMYISLFFDVEDCVTPISDDIAKDLADIMSDHGLVGDFMVVGDKARTLESRGRWDVIEALGRHEVGLHTNRHSRHPTVAEYLEDMRWNDGIEEVVRREGPGVATIEQLFGKSPPCWGQGGGSWGPQVHPAMKRLGVPIIVYPETRTPSSDIHWYSGVLTFGYYRFFGGFDQLYSNDSKFQSKLRSFKNRVETYLDAGYPWMGVFCAHPITVRAYEFGDAINFGHGKETPPESWTQPLLKSEDEYRNALKNFEVLVEYVAAHPRLEVVPVGALEERFGRVADSISQDDLLSYATAACGMEDIQTDDARLSPAEAVDVLAQAILALSNEVRPGEFAIRHVDGPVTMPSENGSAASTSWASFRSGCDHVKSFINRAGQLPASVDIDGTTVGIGSFYHAACESFVALADHRTPESVAFRAGPQIPGIAKAIAVGTEGGYRGWVIHKPDLNMTNLLELTRLQTWTIKPASY